MDAWKYENNRLSNIGNVTNFHAFIIQILLRVFDVATYVVRTCTLTEKLKPL